MVEIHHSSTDSKITERAYGSHPHAEKPVKKDRPVRPAKYKRIKRKQYPVVSNLGGSAVHHY